MEASEFLKAFVKQAEPAQKRLFKKLREDYKDLSGTATEMINILEKFSQRGKQLRGSLVVLGYQCTGRKENKEIIKAASAVEIIHAAALIADDIMDKADLRREEPTIHKIYKHLAAKYQQQDQEHFGLGMALNLSLMAIFLAEYLFSNLTFEKKRVLTAQSLMNQYLIKTTFGQGLDMTAQKNLANKIEHVLLTNRLKTAYYTISGPLQVGGILGGGGKNQLKAMEDFGLTIGTAFQLKDDELGILGKEQTTGKSISSDLKEGKSTFLFLKALKKATAEERECLEKAFGNQKITKNQLEKVRDIIKITGALKDSQDTCRQLLKEGISYIPKITKDKTLQKTLNNLAEFIIERGK